MPASPVEGHRIVAEGRRGLAAPTYLVALGLACIPLFDAAMQLLPYQFGHARWRFGAFGLVSNSFMLTLAGFLIAFVGSALFGHRRTHRTLRVMALVAAILTTLGLVVFALDALQVQRDVTLAARLAFRVASITAAAKATLAIVTLFAAARASHGRRTSERAKAEPDKVLLGSPIRSMRVG